MTMDGTHRSGGAVLLCTDFGERLKRPRSSPSACGRPSRPNTRLLGTIEWTNWSRFGVIPINRLARALGGGNDLTLPGNWHDGWLYSVGLEYDVNQKLTVRTGVAFEKSPIQNATERLIQVPDSDRWWASVGATYKWSEKFTFDFAYTHIFFDDAPFDRTEPAGLVDTSTARPSRAPTSSRSA